MYVNGDISGSSGGLGNFTHYFIESQRIATRLEHVWNQQVSAPDAGDSISYSQKEKQSLFQLLFLTAG